MNKQIFAIFLIIFLTIGLCGCNENKNNSQNNVDNQNDDTSQNDLKIISSEITTFIILDETNFTDSVVSSVDYKEEDGFFHHENSSYYDISGKIINSDTEPYVEVEIVANFYDSDNVFLINLTDDIHLIAVGEEKDFSIKYLDSYDYFNEVESVKFELIKTKWSDSFSEIVIDGELSGPSDGSLGKWTLLSFTNDDHGYLLDNDGKIDFPMTNYGEFVNKDHIVITGEYVDLPSFFYALKIDTISVSTTPIIGFTRNSQEHKIQITSVGSDDILWSDISITGDCNTSALGNYVKKSDIISECSGDIVLKYISNNVVLFDYEFDILKLYCTLYSTEEGNLLIDITGGSLDPANARIIIGTPPNFGFDIYNPEPFESIDGATVAIGGLGDGLDTSGNTPNSHSYTFEWNDNDQDNIIDAGDIDVSLFFYK